MARVRYFAAAEEAAGVAEQARAETSLTALRDAVIAESPGLRGILPRCTVLVDGVRVGLDDGDAVLNADTLVDVLPPFAGG